MPDNSKYSHPGLTAGERDKASPVWDMSQERVYIETLLNQRFNFLLVLFSLVIAGVINSKLQIHLQIILTIGSIIIFSLGSVLRRTQEKLDFIITDIFTDQTHPATIIDRRSKRNGSRRRLIGIYIPWFVFIVLVVGAVLAWFNILKVP